ncbi:MAG TPA: 4a-hydroxytetrahydrobiopterin dehydratase [Gammaproteobacteria bacterium]|nr:4a-hydroxytetrahydrobiopterin dehydratase [Gammaproteobacteria bacterium]
MSELTEKSCQICESGAPSLSVKEIDKLKVQIPLWQVADDLRRISRRFEFKGFYKTMAFVNAVAWIANQEGHHPDMHVGYNYCEIDYQTHAINGLSENDFICAAKIDQLFTE